jgi:hypothetical protein
VGGEAVVVAHLDLLVSDGVVLVEDGEEATAGEEVVEGTVEGMEDAGSPKGEEEGKRSFHGCARSVTSRRERKRCTIAKRATGR